MSETPNEKPRRGRGRPPREEKVRNQRQVTIHLPQELIAALDEEAKRAGTNGRSEIVRRACSEYLERSKTKEEA